MAEKVKITVVVPEQLQNDMREAIIHQGYGLRGKSLWVAEAIERLLGLDNVVELVGLGDELHGFEKVETIAIPRELKARLDQSIIDIRKQLPLLDGVQSRIIRSAILQRLIRGM